MAALPENITLVRVPGDAWQDPATAEFLAAPLRQKGFADLGVYYVLPFTGARLGVMLNEKDKVAAYISERDGQLMPTTLELNVRYTDGTFTMMVNHGDNGVPRPPFCRVIFDQSDASSAELFERLLRERSSVGIKTITADNVLPEYQAAWTRIMRWEKGRGLNDEEIRRISAGGPKKAEICESVTLPPAAISAPSADLGPNEIRCPHCGQANEKEREVCWACYQFISGGEKSAAREVVGASLPPQASGGLGVFLDSLRWWAISILFMALGGFVLFRFYGPARDEAHRVAAQSAQAEGRIVETKRYHGRGNAITHIKVKILFTTTSGRPVIFGADLGRQAPGGSQVPVRYDPQAPTNCDLGPAGEASHALAGVLLCGGGLILSGIVICLWKFPFLLAWRRR
jgi:hypothetical protein